MKAQAMEAEVRIRGSDVHLWFSCFLRGRGE